MKCDVPMTSPDFATAFVLCSWLSDGKRPRPKAEAIGGATIDKEVRVACVASYTLVSRACRRS
jgi:hypothetical protein